MEHIRLIDVARALSCPANGVPDSGVTGVSTDSRTLNEDDLFFAIRGERFDGHDFVSRAFERGAAAAVVSDEVGTGDGKRPLLVVDDTTAALQDLAGWYRLRFTPTVVAVTGTNGKTTTKDMAAAAIAMELRTMKTTGNLNNHIGLPLTLFGLAREHEAAVVEMGMSNAGEIARLCEIARPRIGVITNVAEAHLASMLDVDAIARAKGELLDALPGDGVAVLNADDPRVMSQAGRTRSRVITFGLSREADFRASDVSEAPGAVSFTLAGHGDVTLPVPGRHNIANALAALAAASAVGIGMRAAARGLARFEASPMRMDVSTAGSWTIVNDAYNSNPGSLSAALRTLVSIGEGAVTAAVLGDMLELGERSESAHREAGRQAAELGVDYLFLFGTEVRALREGALMGGMAPSRAAVFESKVELVRAMRRALTGSAAVLVKGSRGMRMEEAVEMLTQKAPAN